MLLNLLPVWLHKAIPARVNRSSTPRPTSTQTKNSLRVKVNTLARAAKNGKIESARLAKHRSGDLCYSMLDRITVHGARQHNLKNIDLEIPRNTFTVITGLSGSGKSSLAFDTIYAEGQRRYVETLSPYARQFLDQMERPDVDSIDGLSPAISIEQKTTNRSPRSTVGTITEIYDYLRVLYASIGVPHCPNCGHEIARQTSEQILEQVLALGPQERVMILAPIVRGRKGEYKKELDKLSRQGFVRARVDGVLRSLDEEITLDRRKNHTIEVVVDRLLIKPEVEKRLAASIETATKLAGGLVQVAV